jgi:Ca2+-binding EF-hand superfamily protein
MIATNPRYKQFVGANKEETREPAQLLSTYVDKIAVKFNSLNEFCKVVDMAGNGYITKKSLLRYFQNLDPELKDVEFIEILKILDPTRGKNIKYYQLRETLKKALTPKIKLWLGEMLNKYDETKESLGMALKGKNPKLKKKYQKDVLESLFKGFRNFEGGQFSIFLELIDIEEDYNLNIAWKSLRLKLKDLLIRYNLRESATILAFLSSKPPAPETKDGKPQEPVKEEDAHLEFLSNLRQKLKILNDKQAEKIFEKIDENKSGIMAMHEFEDFIAYDVLRQAYEFISGGKS